VFLLIVRGGPPILTTADQRVCIVVGALGRRS
jgi:hypothetical protein